MRTRLLLLLSFRFWSLTVQGGRLEWHYATHLCLCSWYPLVCESHCYRSECDAENEGGEESCSQDTSAEESNDEEEEDLSPKVLTPVSLPLQSSQDNKVVLQLTGSSSKPATYKLRDSRFVRHYLSLVFVLLLHIKLGKFSLRIRCVYSRSFYRSTNNTNALELNCPTKRKSGNCRIWYASKSVLQKIKGPRNVGWLGVSCQCYLTHLKVKFSKRVYT